MRLDKENCIMFDTVIDDLTVGTAQLGDILNGVKPGSPKDELYVVGVVRSAVTSANSTATVNVIVEMDSAVDFGTAPITIVETGALALTALTAGTRLFARRLPLALKQYIRAKRTVAVEAVTAGKIDIFLVDGVDFKGMNDRA